MTEAEFYYPVLGCHERRSAVAFQRLWNDPEFTLDASLIPDHKAAYIARHPTMDGGVWVGRQGSSVRLPDCAEDPLEVAYEVAAQNRCWTDEWIHDAFDVDGRYLGEVDPLAVRQSRIQDNRDQNGRDDDQRHGDPEDEPGGRRTTSRLQGGATVPALDSVGPDQRGAVRTLPQPS